MSKGQALALAGLMALGSAPGQAAEYRQSGDWAFTSAAVAETGSGVIEACTAQTTSADGSTFSVVLTPGATAGFAAEVRVENPGWRFAGDPVQLRVDIGPARWMMAGTGTGSRATLPWAGGASVWVFLEELASAATAGLVGRDGRPVAQFSLRGSRGAVEAVKSCIEGQIGPGLRGGAAAEEGHPF